MMHRPFAYSAARLLPDGTVDPDARVLRRVLVDQLGLKPRDIVALFSKDGRMGFDLNVRSGCLLLSLGRDGPSAIIGTDSAWILARGSTVSSVAAKRLQHHFLEVASQAVSSGHLAAAAAGGGGAAASTLAQDAQEVDGAGFDPSDGRDGPVPTEAVSPIPFALTATEAFLIMFLDRLTASLQRYAQGAATLVNDFASPDTTEVSAYLEVLRRTKQRLDYLKEQAKSLQKALFEALGDEDDLEQLAGAVGATKEEWELCFEHYSQTVEEIGLEALQQLETLEDLERTISLRLSCRRLEVEKLQLYLEVLGNGLSMGALMSGIFGMNLMSGLESRPRMFWPVCVFVAFSCFGVSCGLHRLVHMRLRRGGGGGSLAGLPGSGRRRQEAVKARALRDREGADCLG